MGSFSSTSREKMKFILVFVFVKYVFAGVLETDWPKICSSGSLQSPIYLPRIGATPVDLGEIEFHYYQTAMKDVFIENTGSYLEISVTEWREDVIPSISGGGLDGDFVFHRAEIHWGRDLNE